MLEQLDSIDWKSHGAEYMPELIRGMASPDQKVRSGAYNRLELIFYPLPTGVWEDLDPVAIQKLLEMDLPVLVAPFFIELLESEVVERKSIILQWLEAISRYREYVEDETHWEQAMKSFEAVKIGMPIYQRLVNDANPHIKALALEVIHNLQVE